MSRTRCPGHVRHWFSLYGMPGVRSPVCVRCAAPNPCPLSAAEWDSLAEVARLGWTRRPEIIRALAEHKAAAERTDP